MDEKFFSINKIKTIFHKLGIQSGDLVMLHCRLSSLGTIPCREYGLITALLDCVGNKGGIITPGYTTYLSHPQHWTRYRPKPEEIITIESEMAEFSERLHSPQSSLGAVARGIWQWEGSYRSNHPLYSFVGIGASVENILSDIPVDYAFGSSGVLGRLYEKDVKVLVIGLDWWEKFTMFHLAESKYYYPGKRIEILKYKQNDKWYETRQIVLANNDFKKLSDNNAIISELNISDTKFTLVSGSGATDLACSNIQARDFTSLKWTNYWAKTIIANESCY